MKHARFLIPALSAALAQPAFAHPGHGEPSRVASVWHYLLEPEHLPLMLLALVVVGIAARRVWLSRRSDI